MNNESYFDYAAATPTDPRVVEAMRPFFGQVFGNPSSLHGPGRQARQAVDAARKTIAEILEVNSVEIIFTGSGTESNNLAILGAAKANRNRGQRVITSAIEHPSVLNAFRALEKEGFEAKYIGVDKNGLIRHDELISQINSETILASLHLANSELGIIQDIGKLSAAIKAKNPDILIHVDACQAPAYIPVQPVELGADLLTLNGSKLYGPKGIGLLYVRAGVNIFPILYGGGQEQSLRSGTENVPSVVGLAKALEIARDEGWKQAASLQLLRDKLQKQLAPLPGAIINVADSPRLPNHLSVTLGQTSSRDLVADFDQADIALSAGSACSSRTLGDSHVLSAIGLNSDQINKTVRISLGRATTEKKIKAITAIATKLSK